MLPVLLIFLPLTCSVKLSELKWQPELISKQSIFLEHSTILPRPNGTVAPKTLAYVTVWNPRGFLLARKQAARLDFISPVWYDVEPMYDLEDVFDVRVEGHKNFNRDFIRSMRRGNPRIKVVPRFKFENLAPEVALRMVQDGVVVRRIAQTIADYCHQFGFDGLVLEVFHAIASNPTDEFVRINIFEAIVQMGHVLRQNGLISILSLPAPIRMTFKDGEYHKVEVIRSLECESLLDAFDHVQLWTYSDVIREHRNYGSHDWFVDNIEQCGASKKLMLGINFYGYEWKLDNLDAVRPKQKTVTFKRYMQVMNDRKSSFLFNEDAVEHELILPNEKAFIVFPTMTSLEYRMQHAWDRNLSLAFWDYGQGLDYFTNLV